MAETDYDVIIAGAGPVGIFLSCELALAGISTLILERELDPSSPWKEPGLGFRGLQTTSVEAFYRRNLLNQLLGASAKDRPTHLTKRREFQFVGHFAGIMIDGNKVDWTRFKYLLPGPSVVPAPTTVSQVESVLAARANELGVRILRGVAVSGFVDCGENVQVTAGEHSFTAQYLVGCDGGRSTIRQLGGFEFLGSGDEFTGYVTNCEINELEKFDKGFVRTSNGMYINVPYDMYVNGPSANSGRTNMYAIDFRLDNDRLQPVTREQFEEVLHRVSGIDVTVKALHLATKFTARAMQATEYRRGRILLAGDSAHIHSPIGAQGLNTGIGDAMNLGWKLAATVKGLAAPGLLDTYHKERHPVAAGVLEWTRAQVTTLRPDSFGRAIGDVVKSMTSSPDGAAYMVERIWGIGQRYAIEDTDAHDLVGRSVPDIEFDDGRRLGPLLSQGKFLLVDFENDAAAEVFSQALCDKITHVRGHAETEFGMKQMLVRPDGIVAFASSEPGQIDRINVALSQWIN